MTDLLRPGAHDSHEKVDGRVDPADIAVPAPRAKTVENSDTTIEEPDVSGHSMLAEADVDAEAKASEVVNGTKIDDKPKVDEAESNELHVPDSLAPDARVPKEDYVQGDEAPDKKRGIGRPGRITAAVIGVLSALGIGVAVGRSSDTTKETGPAPTELEGKPAPGPELSTPTNTPSGELPPLSADPFVTPSGEAIQYNDRLEGMGELLRVPSPNQDAETAKNEDLVNWFYDSVEPSIEKAVAQNGKILTTPGCAVHTVSYTVEGTGEKIDATLIDIMPAYSEKVGNGKIVRSYTSIFDDGGTSTVITEGKEGSAPNEFDRVAYAAQDVQFVPFSPDVKPVEVQVSRSEDVSKQSNQRGAGGVVAKSETGSKFVIGRHAIVVGKQTPEQLEATCRQLVVNTGYKA